MHEAAKYCKSLDPRAYLIEFKTRALFDLVINQPDILSSGEQYGGVYDIWWTGGTDEKIVSFYIELQFFT